jgi:hypothetical protein
MSAEEGNHIPLESGANILEALGVLKSKKNKKKK